MNLFQNGEFTLASGATSNWKVECDALAAPGNWEWAAQRIAALCAFREVHGVPTGGMRLAEALAPLCRPQGCILFVDDVWTTGASMRVAIDTAGLWGELAPVDDVKAWVVFSRAHRLPLWARALWVYTGAPEPVAEIIG